ncbi:hypothetical protein D9V32_15050 [Mycetocola tolaasinivorans]|uniref:Asp23/Gls24 family envelope stress response protein n=1 Tax=Mycetocola tolaasinivorans TaxID=76635 RepID=A0A3L6ZZZ3_9MICO|nr:hypothetical protein [Mycetocola tolaasinivorans]RLP72762.1 hypothetical protein D9V32_15050 [Mycetocola tolaasinivorans]
MTADVRAETGERSLTGRTTVTGRALQHLAIGVVRDAARVSAQDITVTLSDDAGNLRAAVTVPVALGSHPGETLIIRGEALRDAVIRGLETLAGRTVSTVDIRYSGIREVRERRVL